jgi:light-regulated signal transduction histidine kinase (bacteriophytochrome)
MVEGIYECSVHQIKTNYVYVQLRNVTELELAKVELKHKKELERKNKELEQFTFITSHDLQEPLRSIISFSSLLEKEKEKMGEVGQKSIEVIKRSASRMRALIISLLEYSTIGREKEKKEVDIERLIESLKIDLHDLIDKKQATVNYVGGGVKIQAYKPDLIKLFQHLIVNGIKYTKENTSPVITIDYEEQKNYYKFSIQDNGIGIAEGYYDKVFEIFQRLYPGSNDLGTGIGLSVCKKVVELHDGEIWLASELGRGTTFYFTIKK